MYVDGLDGESLPIVETSTNCLSGDSPGTITNVGTGRLLDESDWDGTPSSSISGGPCGVDGKFAVSVPY